MLRESRRNIRASSSRRVLGIRAATMRFSRFACSITKRRNRQRQPYLIDHRQRRYQSGSSRPPASRRSSRTRRICSRENADEFNSFSNGVSAGSPWTGAPASIKSRTALVWLPNAAIRSASYVGLAPASTSSLMIGVLPRAAAADKGLPRSPHTSSGSQPADSNRLTLIASPAFAALYSGVCCMGLRAFVPPC